MVLKNKQQEQFLGLQYSLQESYRDNFLKITKHSMHPPRWCHSLGHRYGRNKEATEMSEMTLLRYYDTKKIQK